MYVPSPEMLKKYADILVKFALRSGRGCQPGDVVMLQVPECAKPILEPLQLAVLEAGGHPLIQYLPDGLSRPFYLHANDEQIIYNPKQRLLGTVEDVTHTVSIIAEADKHELEGIDSKKMMARLQAMQRYRQARQVKEGRGEFTWTLGLYGTQAMADEVGMSLEEYRDQIIKACYLDYDDPIAQWQDLFVRLEDTKSKLNALQMESVHMVGPDADITIKLGQDRQWLGGSGRNIPSFELFISPDWRGTEWRIRFNQPLYYHSTLITGVQLWFEKGKVVKATADKNEQVLLDMIAVEHADKIGEYSLTDKDFSRITRFMGETLYDENVWGEYGNTHLALGMAYKDSYISDESAVSPEERDQMWFNESAVHTDMMSTTPRTVTATLSDGTTTVIYKDGKFLV